MFDKVEQQYKLKNAATSLQKLKNLSEDLKINQQKFKNEKSLSKLITLLENYDIIEVDIPRFQKKHFYKVMFRRLQLFYIEATNIVEQTTEKDLALQKSFEDNDQLRRNNRELSELNTKLVEIFVS